MLHIWEELDRLENIFLELLDDPMKKEILLYPICYCQLVRRTGNYEVPLPRLRACAEKPFKLLNASWQDILFELGIFFLKDRYGKVYSGKEILSIKGGEDLTVSINSEYKEDFYQFYTKLLKYWGVLSSKLTYGKPLSPDASTHMLGLVFNEELFKEARYYSEILSLRFPKESSFFIAIKLLAEFYQAYREKGEVLEGNLKKALTLLGPLPDRFYMLNTLKLKKDIQRLRKSINRGEFFIIKLEFKQERKKPGLLGRLYNLLKKKFFNLGGKRWSSHNSETDYYSFIETFLRRRKRRRTLRLGNVIPRLLSI